MDECHIKVKLVRGSGEAIDGEFVFDPDEETCALTLRFSDQEMKATEEDYFEALSAIRRRLEISDLRPLCYGASRTVYPSPMSRDMSAGLSAYRLRLGIQALSKDLVHIFDTGPDVQPVTVEEQQEFFEQWIASLKKIQADKA